MTAFGAGARALIGQRSRGRPLKATRAGNPQFGFGSNNPNYVDSTAAHSLAIVLMRLGQADSKGRAAVMSVMLREGFDDPRLTILAGSFDDTDKMQAAERKQIEKKIRRLRDKLYADVSLDEDVARLRAFPSLEDGARAYRDRLIARARRFERAVAALQSEPK